MKIRRLTVRRYRGLRDLDFDFDDLSVLIGANASGKSAILDALRFLRSAVTGGIESAVAARGGITRLAWRGEEEAPIELTVALTDESRDYEWVVRLERRGYDLTVEECVRSNDGASKILESRDGRGRWWSSGGTKFEIEQPPTACALAAASASPSSPTHAIAGFIRRWGLFDPSPVLLRRDSTSQDSACLDYAGGNLAKTLQVMRKSSPEAFERVVSATRAVLGVPETLEPRETDGRFYFVFGKPDFVFGKSDFTRKEPGRDSAVHQIGASSGTLRVLALMVALHASPETSLVGIEEPENHLHPSTLESLMEQVLEAAGRSQVVLTTHSPLVLDGLDRPEAVVVIRREETGGAKAERETDPEGVRRALRESGFGLGEYYGTRGFGAR